MSLVPGSRLGPYEILALLGAGGMGEVYRARDTTLNRDVALKVLIPEVARDEDRLARFRREAKVLASLNHPHIGAIYGFEDAGDMPALVLELVEGETLDDRLARGALPLSEALAVAGQIADALDAAHGAGIIHRDLKPSNIKITPDGVVKVLDFGLAKAGAGEASMLDLSKSPTMTRDETQAGAILGTAAYMSPEQSRGRVLDKRTDIWAFGCVLYQTLTGRPAFRGESLSDLIVAILERDADWTALPAGTPPAVRRLLQRCLEKDARRRLRDIGDVRHWLDDYGSGEAGVRPAAPSPWRALAWLLGGVALASAGFAGWQLWSAPAEAPGRNVQLQRLTDFVGMEESPAISPDGKTIAFVARAGSRRQIFVRLLAGGAPLQITRDDVDHERPRWARDSSSLIYYVPPAISQGHGTIWEISALGGEPRRVAPALSAGDISHDGRRIALFRSEGERIALVLVWRDGSRPDELRQMPLGDVYEHPRWSPDDRWIACQYYGPGFDGRLLIFSLTADREPQEVARGTYLRGLAWLQDGSGIVYSSSAGSTILYPPIANLRAVERNGTGDRQLTFGDVSYVEPDVHASGLLAASRIRTQSDIWKFPVTASPAENTRGGVRMTHQTGQAQTPSVSPDESEVVYLSDSGGHGNLWVARTDGSGLRQLTFERDPTISVGLPVWSTTGTDIVFILTRQGAPPSIGMINRDGSGQRQFVSNGVFANWSADGQWIYYVQSKGDTNCIHKAPLTGKPTITLRCDYAVVAPSPVPDGSALYFVKALTSRNAAADEIYRARPEDGPSELLASVAGSRAPLGREYVLAPVLSPDGKLLAMPLRDVTTSNIWALPTDGGPMRPLTDFGDRAVEIVRRVSWSPTSKFAVAETDADIVLLDGLVR